MLRSLGHPAVALAGALGLVACGDDGAVGAATLPAGAPPVAATASTCAALGLDERVLSSSPEGDLWVIDDASGALRVIQPDGTSTAPPVTVDRPARVQAWSDARATALTEDGALLTLDGVAETVTQVRLPVEAGAPLGFCGDPTRDGDGFVLADGLLERSAGQWWRWTPAASGTLGAPRRLGHAGGACRPLGGDVWVGVDDALWRLDASRAERFPGVVDLRRVAPLGPRAPAVLAADGTLRLGADGGLLPVDVAVGAVRTLDASQGWLWVAAGGAVYGLDGSDRWRRLAPAEGALGAGDVTGVWAHAAGGVWTLDAGTVCHHALGPLLRVRGVRADEVRAVATAELLVESDAGGGEVTVRLDGAEVAAGPLVDGRFAAPRLDLGGRGLHRLEVALAHGDGVTTRALPFDLHPLAAGTWAGDVQPVFEAHCAGGPCHGPAPSSSDRPDLSTFDGWVDHADTIRRRVGVIGDMPPPELRSADWGPDQVEAIVGWIDGGMERGE